MKPARRPSRWVKVRAWFYTERRTPTRAVSDAEAIRSDWAAVASDLQAAIDEYEEKHHA